MTDSSNNIAAYKEQIAELEADIYDLQTRLNARDCESVSCKSFSKLKALKHQAVQADSSSSRNEEDSAILNKIKDEIGALEMSTGVEVMDVIGLPLHRSDSGSCDEMEYVVNGSSHGIEFKMNFIVTKMASGVAVKELRIDSIELINNALGHILDEIENESWMQGFIKVFVPYTKLMKERRDAFGRIKERFSNDVQFPKTLFGSRLDFFHKTGNQIVFQINWDFEISAQYQHTWNMSHLLTLNVEAPASESSNKVLTDAPEMFKKMLESLNPEVAVTNLVTSCTQ